MKRADHQIIQDILDGSVTPGEFAAFQSRLRAEPDLAGLYREYALLHHTLCEEFEGGNYTASEVLSSNRRLFGISKWIIPAILCAVVGALWWYKSWKSGEIWEDAAVATFSLDAVWQIEGTTHDLGGATGMTSGGVMHLQQGRALIYLQPSVSIVAEGPAEMIFHSSTHVDLNSGRMLLDAGGTAETMTVTTPQFTVETRGAAYGIDANAGDFSELHAGNGTVQLTLRAQESSKNLTSGQAVRISKSGLFESIPNDVSHFAKNLGHYRPIIHDPFDKSLWRIEYGSPTFSEFRIEGANYSIFQRLPATEPNGENAVLLATLEVGKPAAGGFHTDGWAGMSLFYQGKEIVFFGDSYGTKPVWSLDIKQNLPVILPISPISGPKTVTLRYDSRSREVSLHEGTVPLQPAFCRGRLPAGTRFDEFRIGASAGAAITVNSLTIRVSEH